MWEQTLAGLADLMTLPGLFLAGSGAKRLELARRQTGDALGVLRLARSKADGSGNKTTSP